MGGTNSIVHNKTNLDRIMDDEINIERTIDDEKQLYLCIVKQIGSNPYSSQALKVGRG
jgi:hypothetical protein